METCDTWLSLLLLFLFVLLLQFRHHRRIRQRRGVPQRATVGDIAQQPAHDLTAARLGQLRGKENFIRPGDRADLLGHVFFQLVDQRARLLDAAFDRVGELIIPEAVGDNLHGSARPQVRGRGF